MKKHGLPDPRSEDKAPSLTPLIDVTFLLLIFFLLTLHFRALDGKLAAHLPKDARADTRTEMPATDVEVVIRVERPGRRVEPGTSEPWDGVGRFDLVDRVVSFATGPDPTTDLATLNRELRRLHRLDPERALRIDPREGVVTADVVAVVDLAVQAGYTDITFEGAR